jgi:hypothetical protein
VFFLCRCMLLLFTSAVNQPCGISMWDPPSGLQARQFLVLVRGRRPKTGQPSFPLLRCSGNGIFILADFHFLYKKQVLSIKTKTKSFRTMMPCRCAINNVSIRYKTFLIEFMFFLDGRVQLYPASDTMIWSKTFLSRSNRGTLEGGCAKSVGGLTDPGLEDHPIHGRSSWLEFYKKALLPQATSC